MRPYPRPLYKSTRVRHFVAGAAASFLLFSFLIGVVGCERTGQNVEPRGVDVEVDVRPAPCDSLTYEEPSVTERREIDPEGNVRVRVTVRTCCCGDARDSFSALPYPITGTGPRPPCTPSRGSIAPPTDAPPAPPIASIPPLRTIPPVGGSFPGGVPIDPPPPITATSSPSWWLSLIVAPIAFISDSGSKKFPDGVICDGDSGLPTGPMRPRC